MKRKKQKTTLDVLLEAQSEHGVIEANYAEVEIESLKKSNTNEYLMRSLKEHIEELSKDSPTIDAFEEVYRYQCPDQSFDIRDMYKDKEYTPLEVFMYCVESGFYPPPEVMFSLLNAFQYYFSSEGEVELEEAFFGPKTKRLGNYSAKKAKDEKYRSFHFFVNLEKLADRHANRRVRSLSQLYHDYFTNDHSITKGLPFHYEREMTMGEITGEEAFLRGYGRWKGEQ